MGGDEPVGSVGGAGLGLEMQVEEERLVQSGHRAEPKVCVQHSVDCCETPGMNVVHFH